MSHISLGAKHARTYPKEKQAWTDLREGEGEEMGERESSGERERVLKSDTKYIPCSSMYIRFKADKLILDIRGQGSYPYLEW